MIANEWGPSFTDNYGHVFPNTYLCIDTEYTGGNERDDLIVEIGHIMVQDGEVVDRMNVVLDWTRHEGISSSNLRYKLDNIRSRMGSDWRVTWEVMQEEGISPLKAFRFYDKLFSTWSDRGLPYVAHNGRTAEERMIRGNFNRFINKPFFMQSNQLWDTGALFKATRLFDSKDLSYASQRWKSIPEDADSLKSYFNRVIGARVRGLSWNLKYCLEYYDLIGKLEDSHRFHQADYDAYCSHLLMQKFRSQATRDNSTPAVPGSSEASSDVFDSTRTETEIEAGANEVLSKLVEEAPRQPLTSSRPTQVDTPAHVPEVEPPIAEPPTQSRPQPARGRKRGQRVI